MKKRSWTVSLLLLLCGCAVGPQFQRPVPPESERYTHEPVTLPSAGKADETQSLHTGAQVQARWWSAFHSKALEQVVQTAIEGSPNLQAARANLAQAREEVAVARAGLFPRIDIGAAATREKKIGTLYSAGPAVSYNPDVFGGVRRLVEEQGALAEVRRYDLAATYLSLTGDAVSLSLDIASAREQIGAVEDILGVDRRNLQLVRIAYQAGKVPRSDVLNAESQLASDEALLPGIRQQLDVSRHALSVLSGRSPAQWAPPQFDLASLTLPTDLPVQVPSALARERPDILAAEAELHAATAAVGVATANLYPSFPLSASWNLQAATLGALFDSAGGVYTLAAQITAPLFHGGALRAQRRAAVDAMSAELALYRETVLQAFGQIADSLRALQHDAEALAAQRAALDSAQAALELDQESYAAGQATLLEVLQAQRLFGQARLGYARARGQRYLDTVQLFLAMGGGWEGSAAVPPG